jgi:GNAT superfamily N-acetyltransferase
MTGESGGGDSGGGDAGDGVPTGDGSDPDAGADATADVEIRPATHDDYDGVAAFTRDTWEDGDYIPDVYHDWIDGDRKRTLVADAGDAIAGIAQFVLLSDHEAWGQGMRVNPEFRGEGISRAITHALFDWGREQGATVARNMVFSWNQAGLGQSRATGYEPVTEFRWLHPDPAPGRPDSIVANPDAAWSFWTHSDARDHLQGLGLSPDESWALQELTRDLLCRVADETTVLGVTGAAGTRAMAYRTRTLDREVDGESERWAEYGVGAWADLDAARALLDGIAADAADAGADRTRVLVPETAQYVTDGAYLRANISDEPDFVLAADLTGAYRSPPVR